MERKRPVVAYCRVSTLPRGKKGCKAATLWELHPVTDLKFAQP